MKVILIRHGETTANRKGIFSGHLDAKLTEKGKEQAINCRNRIVNLKIDYVFSSDLSRAVDTAKIVIESRNLDIEEKSGLREMNFGEWEGCKYDEIGEKYPDEFNVWSKDTLNIPCLNGESRRTFYFRVIKEYKELINRFDYTNKDKNKTIAIFAHSGVVRSILSSEIIGDIDGYWKFEIDNCSVNILEYDEKGFCYAKKINSLEKI
ncbi:histidine phosphatase family protein [Helicovermis profundi]|uniref:Alpha-ribazole phosphatase n=1 Tax=Helicovermis profundi TaxID=3065157 RepID=A0AAU9EL11_9FIRM|nr:alpha-ribazole phosphatase [Clostridia bacterium S502]